MRLIDADVLKMLLHDDIDGLDEEFPNDKQVKPYMCGVKMALSFIDTAPTIDAVPVVRCKDCRHAVDYYHEGDCYCSNPKWGLNYFGGSWEFYCADAERRNNE